MHKSVLRVLLPAILTFGTSKHTLHHYVSEQKFSQCVDRIYFDTDGVAGHCSDDYRHDRTLETVGSLQIYRSLYYYKASPTMIFLHMLCSSLFICTISISIVAFIFVLNC